VNDNHKHSSLFRYGIDYGRKGFMIHARDFKPKFQLLSKRFYNTGNRMTTTPGPCSIGAGTQAVLHTNQTLQTARPTFGTTAGPGTGDPTSS